MSPKFKVYKAEFEPGLSPKIGDRAYLIQDESGMVVATTKSPNSGPIRGILCGLGLVPKKACLYIGIVVQSRYYHINGHCMVMVPNEVHCD